MTSPTPQALSLIQRTLRDVYLPLIISYANTPKAATMTPAPTRLQTVMVSVAPPNNTSEIKTRTMVSRLPTETRTGPHIPSSTWNYRLNQVVRMYINNFRTMNPALKSMPDRAMPVTVNSVAQLEGNENGSAPYQLNTGIGIQRNAKVSNPMSDVNKFG